MTNTALLREKTEIKKFRSKREKLLKYQKFY